MFSFLKSSKAARELVNKRTALIENAMLQMLAGITFYVSTLGKLREAVISADSDGTFSGVIGKTPFEIKASYPRVSILFKGSNEEFVAFAGSMYAPRQSNPSRVAYLVSILLFILKNDEGVSKQVEENLQCGYILGECLFSARKELVLLEMVEKTSIKKAAVAAEESLKKVNGMLKSVDAIVTAWKADFDEKQPLEVVDKNGTE